MEREVRKVENKLPSELNSPCRPTVLLENDSLEEIFLVTQENRDRFFECYKKHETLLELLNDMGMF